MTSTAHRPTSDLLDRVVLRPVIDSRPPADPPPRASLLAVVPAGPTLFDLPVDTARRAPVPTRRSRSRLVVVPGSSPPNADCVDPLDWCRRLAPALVEVLHGRRPPAQLVRWVDEPVLSAISSELRRRNRRRPLSSAPAVIHSVRVQCPQPDVAEASVHVRTPTRSCALAFQLRATHDRWLCTVVDVGDGAIWTP